MESIYRYFTIIKVTDFRSRHRDPITMHLISIVLIYLLTLLHGNLPFSVDLASLVIDFEFSEEEYDWTRSLYLRLLERTEHVKVWVSFAQFELSVPNEEDQPDNTTRARAVFEKAYKNMKEKEVKEEVWCLFFYIFIGRFND